MGKGSALEGFFAHYDGTGNSDATLAVSIGTEFVCDFELVELCQRYGLGKVVGKPLGRLPELWPFDMLKRPLTEHANEFMRQVATHGYQPLQAVSELIVWGPFTVKVGDVREWVPEADNHTIPKAQRRKALAAWGYQGDELRVDKGVKFRIRGRFIRSAKYGHVEEKTGVLIV